MPSESSLKNGNEMVKPVIPKVKALSELTAGQIARMGLGATLLSAVIAATSAATVAGINQWAARSMQLEAAHRDRRAANVKEPLELQEQECGRLIHHLYLLAVDTPVVEIPRTALRDNEIVEMRLAATSSEVAKAQADLDTAIVAGMTLYADLLKSPNNESTAPGRRQVISNMIDRLGSRMMNLRDAVDRYVFSGNASN